MGFQAPVCWVRGDFVYTIWMFIDNREFVKESGFYSPYLTTCNLIFCKTFTYPSCNFSPPLHVLSPVDSFPLFYQNSDEEEESLSFLFCSQRKRGLVFQEVSAGRALYSFTPY